MSTRIDIGERLRRANPVPVGPQAEPSAGMVARTRKPVLVALIAALFAAGIAVATTISVRYFADSAAKPAPAPVRRALLAAAAHLAPVGKLDLGETISAYTFSSSDGNGQVYMTPYSDQPGFCAALVLTGKPVHAACSGGVRTAATTLSVNGGLQQWSLALTPTMHALLGRLAPSAVGDRVEITFEDGTTEKVPTHGPWFAYAVVGQRTQRGDRPTRIRVLDGSRLTTQFALNPVSFNTLAEARALVPAADGSRGQQAVRRWLLQLLVSPMFGDGGLLASHVDLAATTHVATLRKESGARVDVYGAPVRRILGWRRGGFLLLGLVARSGQLPFFQITASPRAGSTFGRPAGCRCMRNGYVLLNGQVPRGVRRVSIRTRDGHDLRARLFAYGREWAWVGREAGSAAPVELVGRDASGAVVTTRKLLPNIFGP
jgi:hypothetical protein